MKKTIGLLNTVLLFSLFTIITSCNGQTKTGILPNTKNDKQTTAAAQSMISLPAGVSPQTTCKKKYNKN